MTEMDMMWAMAIADTPLVSVEDAERLIREYNDWVDSVEAELDPELYADEVFG